MSDAKEDVLLVVLQHGFMGMDVDFLNMAAANAGANPGAHIWSGGDG